MSANLLEIGFIFILMMLIKSTYTSPLKSFEKDGIFKNNVVVVVPSNNEEMKKAEKAAGTIEEAAGKLKSVAHEINSAVAKLGEAEIKKPEVEETDLKTVSITRDNGFTYKKYHIIYDEMTSFSDATSLCKSKKYSLASFRDENEFDLLTQHLTEHYKMNDNFWTSGNDLDNYGKFHWASNGYQVPSGSKWWWTGEPSGDGEHCLELAGEGNFNTHDPKPGFKLNDCPCKDEKYPICEEDLDLLSQHDHDNNDNNHDHNHDNNDHSHDHNHDDDNDHNHDHDDDNDDNDDDNDSDNVSYYDDSLPSDNDSDY